jgi:ABC-type glycerol-3-phosphate transport system substrate-binding protein
MNKKLFLTIFLIIALAFLAAACGGGETEEPAPEEPAVEEPAETEEPEEPAATDNDEQVAACMESTGLDIEVLPIPGEEAAWQAITQKMQLEAQDEYASWDLIYGPTPFIEPGAMAPLGLLEPLDEWFPQEFWDDIYEGVQKEITSTHDGKKYHIPLWSDVFGLIYRPSMLEAAVGTTEPPKNWDEIISYCEQIEEHYGDEISCFGADWPWSHREFTPMMGTYTSEMFTEEGIWNLDDPAALKALQVMEELYPYMPDNAAEPLGSSKAFQANGVAMMIYWQAQVLRATQAGVPEDDVAISSFPAGDNENTLFWSGGIMIPTYSENKEGAVQFISECILGEQSIRDIFNNFKIVPFKSAVKMLTDDGTMPDWAPPLIALLDVAQAIPSNTLYLTIEQPIFQEEIEKMMLTDQTPEQTLENIKTRIQEMMEETQ